MNIINKYNKIQTREIFRKISELSNPAHADMSNTAQIIEGYKTYEHICKDQKKTFTAAQVLTMIEEINKINNIDQSFSDSFTYYNHE